MSTNPNPPSESLQDRIADWTHTLQPRNPVEAFLAKHAATHAHNIEELEQTVAARKAHHRRTAPLLEAATAYEKVIRLGRELVDPSTDEWVMNHSNWYGRKMGRPNSNAVPTHPELVVQLLEVTAGGCRWLVKQWAELLAMFDENLFWKMADERKAIRLLGLAPDSEDNAESRTLRLSIEVLRQSLLPPTRLVTETKSGRPVPTKEQAMANLREICANAIERLQNLATLRDEQIAPTDPNEEMLRHSFDDSKEGKELRRQLSTEHRELLKSLEMLMKLKKQPEIGEIEPMTAPTFQTSPLAKGDRGGLARRALLNEPPPTPPLQGGEEGRKQISGISLR